MKHTFEKSTTEMGEKYGLDKLKVFSRSKVSEKSRQMMARAKNKQNSLFKKKMNLNVDMKEGVKSLFKSVKGMFN